MSNRIKSKLALGPMSKEIVEAIIRYSHFHRIQLMIIPSKNQVDTNKGYVMKTKEFMNYIKELKQKYQDTNILISRDHCGVGFDGNYDLEKVYETIKSDIENNFDLIHIDFCHYQPKEKQLEETKKAIKYCLKLNPNIMIEIGTDENEGTNYNMMNLKEIENEIDFFKEFFENIEFYVVQTGSLIKELNQVGNFNREFYQKISNIIKEKGLKIKEHNADYLSKEEIQEREGIVDAQNIAPNLGVIQTSIVLSKCLIYGVKFDDFLEEVYKGEKWKKWMHNNTKENKFLCSLIAGHYHFSSDAYKKIIEQLEKREDIRETIMTEIERVIEHYMGGEK